ncbi:hypothetical protein [Micromonospora sp. CPCC 206061]|uniref:hypothetical protein n=1 Tax=Micromonospora sp. CPCC 206061 TaxID=3122410 RepID=UPI002FF0F875
MTLVSGPPMLMPPAPKRSRAPLGGVIALVAALAAAGTLLALSPNGSEPAGPPRVRTVDQAWPDAKRADIPGVLPDGAPYSPAYLLDAGTSIGTATDPGGGVLRLVLRDAAGTVRELRRLPAGGSPQYSGFTRAGDELVWAESVTTDGGAARTEMWIANATGGAARKITGDTGDVVFFNSQYDMVIDAGRLYWVAVAPGQDQVTEVRSVPLAGGEVTVRTEPGAWALSAWPWLVSAGSGQSGPVELRDLGSGKVTTVAATAAELVTCSPEWCRVLVLAGNGPARIDLVRPDGADRRPVADGAATASVIDVALLDRFEVLSQGTDLTTQRLLLYDLRSKESTVVADGAGMVLARGGLLWWSTGDTQAATWYTLDLRSLA